MQLITTTVRLHHYDNATSSLRRCNFITTTVQLHHNCMRACVRAAAGCRSRTFEPCRSDAKCVDWQKLRVQEIMGTDKQQEGQVCVCVCVCVCACLCLWGFILPSTFFVRVPCSSCYFLHKDRACNIPLHITYVHRVPCVGDHPA